MQIAFNIFCFPSLIRWSMIFFLLSFQAILVCANARQPTNLSNGDIGFLEDIGTAFHPQQQNVYKKSSTE